MDKKRIIENLRIGSRTAEDEVDELGKYFVETESWRKVVSGEADIVLAPKGGGKSAIYQTLLKRQDSLLERNIILLSAENVRGDTAFEVLREEDDIDEDSFARIWNLYFLVIMVRDLIERGNDDKEITNVAQKLQKAGLDCHTRAKRTILQRVWESVGSVFKPRSIETTTTFDTATSTPIFTTSIKFGEPTRAEEAKGIVSIKHLFEELDGYLEKKDLTVWILLDRLDAAFSSHPELERNALRALFRVYMDMRAYSRINLKLFLRTDIWDTLSEGGLAEMSHVERDITIKWDMPSLQNVLVQRLLSNPELVSYLGIGEVENPTNDVQESIIYSIYPRQVESGSGKTKNSFTWVFNRIKDGNDVAAPREMLHFYSEVKDKQLKRLETGAANIPDESLFESASFEEAHKEVSDVRLTRTVYSEYTDVKPWVEALKKSKREQDFESLKKIWGTDPSETRVRIDRLKDIGFFSEKTSKSGFVTYVIPFLYMPSLGIVTGAAEGVVERRSAD